MRHLLAMAVLWFFGAWAVLLLFTLLALLARDLQTRYWGWRFQRAVRRKYPDDAPLIHLIRKSAAKER